MEEKVHNKLIEKLVKANPKFSGNEDLLEDFCSETYQKSYLILQSNIDISSLEGYMKKVVSSAIMDVLKKSGRLGTKSKTPASIKILEKPQAKVIKKEDRVAVADATENAETPVELKGAYEYNKAPILAQDLLYIADPRENIEEQIIGKDIIENIVSLVKEIDIEKPQEMFFVLFKERYFLRKKQKEIAADMGISQSEVSKRLVQLSRLIKEKLY